MFVPFSAPSSLPSNPSPSKVLTCGKCEHWVRRVGWKPDILFWQAVLTGGGGVWHLPDTGRTCPSSPIATEVAWRLYPRVVPMWGAHTCSQQDRKKLPSSPKCNGMRIGAGGGGGGKILVLAALLAGIGNERNIHQQSRKDTNPLIHYYFASSEAPTL